MRPPAARLGPLPALAFLIGCGPEPPPDETNEIRALTGARTRIVWVQDVGEQSDPLSERSELRLMGLDSTDRQGARPLLPAVSNYAKPMLSASGDRVVYSDRIDRSVWVVQWDGSEQRKVSDGFAVDIWRDPETGTDWVYTVERFGNEETLPCRRHALDTPGLSEIVWDEVDITWGWLRVAGDGLRAAATCRWPDTGLLDLTLPRWHRYRIGCWPDIAPDGSHLFWAFDSPHRGLHLSREGSREFWRVDLTTAPGVEGLEVYHPRWSNHVRYLAISAPYTLGNDDINLFKGGPQVEIYLGRFDPAYTAIDAWAQVSHNDRGDFWPDVWIEGGERSRIPEAVATPAASAAPLEPGLDLANNWPGDRSRLEFLWQTSVAVNEVEAAPGGARRFCRVEPEGRARWGRFGVMELAGGSCAAPGAGEQVIDASGRSGELSIEAVATPRDPPPNREGTLLCFSDGDGSSQLRLYQKGIDLYLEYAASTPKGKARARRIRVAELPDPEPTHLLVSCDGAQIRSYRNGQHESVSNAAELDPASWEPGPLRFGDAPLGGSDWSGSIEGVAIYARAVGEREAAWKHDLYVSELYRRADTPRFEVQGRLLRLTQTPDARTLAPYRRALAVFTYEIDPAAHHGPDAGQILVAHWTILDGRRIPELADRAVGELYELEIELFDDHEELRTERILLEGVDLALPLYCDVADP